MSAAASTPEWEQRLARLENLLAGLESAAVAFSGGVDSSVLAHAARAALGPRAVALIADSPSLPRSELAAARATAAAIGIRLVELGTRELEDERYRANAGDRCYWCKAALFDEMAAWAAREGVSALVFGEITDDRGDDRPGALAAARAGVRAPLAEAGFGKEDVRRYARLHGLDVAEKPASACLASRLPVGTRVSADRLARVERAEEDVRAEGFRVLRVRDHGAAARVEVGADELERASALRPRLEELLGRRGFDRVELAAYRTPGAPPVRSGAPEPGPPRAAD